MIEIDIPTLVVSSVILLGVITPFILYTIKSKKAKAEFFKKFEEFAAGLNLKVDKREDWRNRYILGLDSTKNVLIYYQTGEKEDKTEVQLRDVLHVNVYQSYLENEKSNGSSKILDQLTLQIHFKNPGKNILNLEIYKSEYYTDLLGETVLASKWAELINQRIIN